MIKICLYTKNVTKTFMFNYIISEKFVESWNLIYIFSFIYHDIIFFYSKTSDYDYILWCVQQYYI